MTDLPAYTLEELAQRARDHIRSRVRGADVAYGSDYDITARLIGTIAFMFQKQVDTPYRLLDPRKAFGTFLREYVGIMGVGNTLQETSYAARRSTGKVIIRSTTGAQLQAAGTILTHADGTVFTLDANCTTSAAAAKTLYAGHRAGRRRVIQGHTGGGWVTPLAGEIYSYGSEYCAVVNTMPSAQQRFFDLYNDLDSTPAMHSVFTQAFGNVGSITASVGGAAGNKDPKDTLTISGPSGTIIATAHILRASGGRDALTPAQMQDAIRKLHSVRQGVMTLDEIREIALGFPDLPLREVFNIPGRYGIGSYTLVPVAEGTPCVNSTDLTAFVSYVDARISPVDKINGQLISEVQDNLTILDIKVTDSFAPDWTVKSALAVQAASTTTRVNLVAGDVTNAVARGLQVNDRVIVSCVEAVAPHVGYIVQRRVTAIGAAYVDVDSALPYPPTTSAYVTPGGPIGQDIIDAIYTHYDGQSPSLLDGATNYFRYPPTDSTDSVQGVEQRVSDVGGVIDVGAVYPSVPALGLGHVLVAGAIQILMWS